MGADPERAGVMAPHRPNPCERLDNVAAAELLFGDGQHPIQRAQHPRRRGAEGCTGDCQGLGAHPTRLALARGTPRGDIARGLKAIHLRHLHVHQHHIMGLASNALDRHPRNMERLQRQNPTIGASMSAAPLIAAE